MPETPNLPLDIPERAGIVIGPTGSSVIFAFALYGATCATMDVIRTTKRVRLRRKIREEEKKRDNESTPPTK